QGRTENPATSQCLPQGRDSHRFVPHTASASACCNKTSEAPLRSASNRWMQRGGVAHPAGTCTRPAHSGLPLAAACPAATNDVPFVPTSAHADLVVDASFTGCPGFVGVAKVLAGRRGWGDRRTRGRLALPRCSPRCGDSARLTGMTYEALS